jgi:hypothetical protein
VEEEGELGEAVRHPWCRTREVGVGVDGHRHRREAFLDEVVECSRALRGLAHNGAAVRAVRDHCFEIVPGRRPGK